MANYAEIIDGKVSQVVVHNGTEAEALVWLDANISKNTWVLTKEDGSTRGKYAGIGDEFHADIQLFIHKPFKSWLLDRDRKIYMPDIPKPLAIIVGYSWHWSEKLGTWVSKKIRDI